MSYSGFFSFQDFVRAGFCPIPNFVRSGFIPIRDIVRSGFFQFGNFVFRDFVRKRNSAIMQILVKLAVFEMFYLFVDK